MASTDGSPDRGGEPRPDRLPGWRPLEEAVDRLLQRLADTRERVQAARAERDRVRGLLEEISTDGQADGEADGSPAEETVRLRAENALLRERMAEARRRLSGLLQRIDPPREDE